MLPGTLLASVFSVGVQSVIPSMLKENYHAISASVASFLNAFPLIAGLVGKTLMLFVYRKKMRDESIVMTVCMASLLFPIGVMCFMGKVSVWVILIMACLILLISNASNIAYASYLPMRFAKVGKPATVSGIINSTASLGIVMASFISPLVADNFGWDYVIYLWILFAFCASLLFFMSFFFWRKFIKQ
ncbi:MAG: MFS transporter [Ruminococcaceae bacterium]|nr:MFS transporter [Oscillospiraceae bacterium]